MGGSFRIGREQTAELGDQGGSQSVLRVLGDLKTEDEWTLVRSQAGGAGGRSRQSKTCMKAQGCAHPNRITLKRTHLIY